MRHGRIEVNPAVMLGKPVVKGTRLTAQQIMEEFYRVWNQESTE